jgi:hypothetical protein
MEPYPFELASTAAVPGLGLLCLEIACRSLFLSQCGHVCVYAEELGCRRGEVSNDNGTMGR